jgi:hypothetical protein
MVGGWETKQRESSDKNAGTANIVSRTPANCMNASDLTFGPTLIRFPNSGEVESKRVPLGHIVFVKPAMLTCHACMRRYVQTLIGDSASVYTWPRTALSSNPSRSNHKRNFTIRRAPVDSYTPDAPAASYTPDAPTVPWRGPEGRKARESTSFNRQRWLESRGQTPLHKQKEKATDDSLFRRQLKHLKDPLKLADYVRTTLREDDFESALAIVRAASKDTQCIVSWNHLIDWQLSKGRMNDAIKTYNEVFDPHHLDRGTI